MSVCPLQEEGCLAVDDLSDEHELGALAGRAGGTDLRCPGAQSGQGVTPWRGPVDPTESPGQIVPVETGDQRPPHRVSAGHARVEGRGGGGEVKAQGVHCPPGGGRPAAYMGGLGFIRPSVAQKK